MGALAGMAKPIVFFALLLAPLSLAISGQGNGDEPFELGDTALTEETIQLLEESEEPRHDEILRDAGLPHSPNAEPPALLEKKEQSAQELAATVARARDDRDQFWKQW